MEYLFTQNYVATGGAISQDNRWRVWRYEVSMHVSVRRSYDSVRSKIGKMWTSELVHAAASLRAFAIVSTNMRLAATGMCLMIEMMYTANRHPPCGQTCMRYTAVWLDRIRLCEILGNTGQLFQTRTGVNVIAYGYWHH